MTEQKTALIIGAGPAGLTAGYKLLKETDIIPIILEASPYIGGISRTAEYHGNRMDLGGHRFFSKNKKINQLWEELLPLQGAPSMDDQLLGHEGMPLAINGPDPGKTERVMLVRNRVSRIFYLRKFFDYPISLKWETFLNMGFYRTVKAGFGYLVSAAHKRPEDSLENFYINRFGQPLYTMFFEDYTEKVWGRHPSRISADWGSQRVKGLSLRKTLANAITKPFRKGGEVETSLIEQFHYPKKGPGQYWETMADEIRAMGGKIYLEHTVNAIGLENQRISSVQACSTQTEQDVRFTADYYFSSMAIKDLFEALPAAVPSDVSKIATELPYRDFMTVGLLVKRLKLKNKIGTRTLYGGVPDCWIYIQERDVQIGRLQIFNNWSPYMIQDPEHTVWIGLEYFCNEGDSYWQMSDEDFIRFAIEELVKIDIIDKADILDSVRLRVKKAYPAYFGSYEYFDQVQSYLESIDNLFCIGRNGQHRYNNMDHSMLTAMTAVAAVQGKADKSEIWKVNTEKEYHETVEQSKQTEC